MLKAATLKNQSLVKEICPTTTQDWVKKGGRSLRAAGFLVDHGYNNVVNMQYGMLSWLEQGYPTIGDNSVLSNNNSTSSNASCC